MRRKSCGPKFKHGGRIERYVFSQIIGFRLYTYHHLHIETISWRPKVELNQDDGKSKQWEEDYQLVENAGLFQEYLEMGKINNCIVTTFLPCVLAKLTFQKCIF